MIGRRGAWLRSREVTNRFFLSLFRPGATRSINASMMRVLAFMKPDALSRPCRRQTATAAGRSSPSGTRRPRARLAAFADRPDDQRLAAAHVAAGEDLVEAGPVAASCRPSTLPRLSRSTPRSLIMPSCTGPRKPMASSTRSALSANSVPAIGFILSSTRTQWSSLTRAVSSPVNFVGHHREVALDAFLLAGRGAQLQRPVRPGRAACSPARAGAA